MKLDWQPVTTIPPEGKFFVFSRAPTSWEPYVHTIRLHADPAMKKLNEARLKYVTLWAYFPEDEFYILHKNFEKDPEDV